MTKVLGDIMKNKLIMVLLALILIVSSVSLIINIRAGHGFNENKSQKYEYTQTTLYSKEDDLYSGHQYIENKIFEKYFIVGIGTRVNYTGFVERPGILNDSDEKQNRYVKEEIVVNNITYSSSYNGEEAEEGKEYIIINVTNYNNENYGRVIRFSADLRYQPDLNEYKDEYKERYTNAIYDYPDGTDTYKMKYDDTFNIMTMVKADASNNTNAFYVKENSSITYNVIYEVNKNQHDGFVLTNYSNRKLRSNSDYMVFLY